MREERIFLEYHGCISSIRGNPFDVLSVQEDFPFIGFIKSCNHAEECRLATAGWSQKGNEMASFKGQIDILDHMAFPEIFIDIL